MRVRLGFVLGMMACAAQAEDATEKAIRENALAAQIAAILGSEVACGLALDPAAIEAWVTANISADNLGFTATVPMLVQGVALEVDGMTAAGKAAHCTAVRIQAQSLGFMAP